MHEANNSQAPPLHAFDPIHPLNTVACRPPHTGEQYSSIGLILVKYAVKPSSTGKFALVHCLRQYRFLDALREWSLQHVCSISNPFETTFPNVY